MEPDASSYGDNRGTGDLTATRRRKIRAPRVRGLLATSGALVVGICLAVTSAGVSFAYINSRATVSQTATVSAGTSGLTLQYGSGTAAQAITIPASVSQNMLPGDFVGIQINVINGGHVPQLIGASVSAASAWETRVATGTCPATLMTGPALTTTSTGSTLVAVGATQTFCVQIALPSTAPAASESTSSTYTINFAGTQSAS